MITRCQPLLGTLAEVTVPDEAAAALAPAFGPIAHVHSRMSFHEPSYLAKLLAAMPGQTVAVSRETVAVLSTALDLYDATDGLFDVTIGRQLVRTFEPVQADQRGYCILDDIHVRIGQRVLIGTSRCPSAEISCVSNAGPAPCQCRIRPEQSRQPNL